MQVRFIFNTKNIPDTIFSFKICKYNEFTYLHRGLDTSNVHTRLIFRDVFVWPFECVCAYVLRKCLFSME